MPQRIPANELVGSVINGMERIGARDAAERLGLPYEEREHNRRLRQIMLSAGWIGPRTVQVYDAKDKLRTVHGYVRQFMQTDTESDPNEALIEALDKDLLPEKLERTCKMGLREMQKVLREPFDGSNAQLMRNKVTAAGIALNAQLRADENRLRHRVNSDVLSKLLKIIEKERQLLTGPGSTLAADSQRKSSESD